MYSIFTGPTQKTTWPPGSSRRQLADNSQQKHQNSDKLNDVCKSVSLKIKLKSPFFTSQGLYLSKALVYCHKISIV
jgi:hypothetical protein